MKGIEYVIDDAGKPKAALVDLAVWGDEWEDFLDVLAGLVRKEEPLVPWESIKAKLAAERKNSG